MHRLPPPFFAHNIKLCIEHNDNQKEDILDCLCQELNG